MLSCTVLELTMLPTCLSTSSLPGSPCDCRDTVSEWLRRWTRNPLGSARRGSNPLGVAFAHSTQDIFALIRHVPERKHIAARSLLAHGIAVARSPPSHVSLLLVRHRSKSHGTIWLSTHLRSRFGEVRCAFRMRGASHFCRTDATPTDRGAPPEGFDC